MITTLVIVALVLTLLIGALLPFGGWGSGMDAAGRGMAMFFPFILMLIRAVCLGSALVLALSGGALDWTGLPRGVDWLVGLGLFGIMAACSFTAGNLIGSLPTAYGRGSFALLAMIIGPIVLSLWLLAETHGVDPVQAWAARALLISAVVGPLPILRSIQKQDALDSAAAAAEEAEAEAKALALANILPRDATLLETLKFHDRLPETEWRARGHILTAAQQRPTIEADYRALLEHRDWNARILAGRYRPHFSIPADEDYFRRVLPTVTEIARRLRENVAPTDVIAREVSAFIGLSWAALHYGGLPKALMQEVHAQILARPQSPLSNLEHDVQILAEYVPG